MCGLPQERPSFRTPLKSDSTAGDPPSVDSQCSPWAAPKLVFLLDPCSGCVAGSVYVLTWQPEAVQPRPGLQCRTQFTIGTLNKALPGPRLFFTRYRLLSAGLGGATKLRDAALLATYLAGTNQLILKYRELIEFLLF